MPDGPVATRREPSGRYRIAQERAWAMRVAALVLGTLLTIGLAGCGGGDDSTPAEGEPATPTIDASPTVTAGTSATPTAVGTDSTPPERELWVAGWYAGWYQNDLPPSAIDFEVVTHLMHFMIVPNPDGSLQISSRPGFENASRIAQVVDAAHGAGRPVLVSVGGAGSYSPGFKEAIRPGPRARLVQDLLSFVETHGYDGVDVDMEPINPDDREHFQAFVRELRSALPDGALLTVAAGPANIICPIQDQFSQINVMTYDMSGPWPGWVSWHNSPVRNGGESFPPPNGHRPLPSAEFYLQSFIAEGCAPAKLAAGIDFYGYVWTGGAGTDTGGVTRPRQAWTSPPQAQANVPYFDLAAGYDLEAYVWDPAAEAAYLSVDLPGSEDDRFVSFDNEQTVAAKVAFARASGHGGVAIWELAGGYLRDPDAPVRDPLLQALKEAIQNGASPTAPTGGR